MFGRGVRLSSMVVLMPCLWGQAPATLTPDEIKGMNDVIPFPTEGRPIVRQGHVSDGKRISVQIVVPPGKQIKAQLGGRFAGELRVRFVNNIRSRRDPGLMVDATNFRNDVSHYKNVTTRPQTIFCTVRNIETSLPQIMAEFTLTFTEGS